MMVRSIISISIFLMLLFTARCGNLTSENEDHFDCDDLIDQQDSVLKNWMVDSLGCKGIRTPEMAEIIVNKFDLYKKDKVDVVKYLGLPNKIECKDDICEYIYYFNTTCVGDSILIQESDKCYFSLIIDSGKLIEFPEVYICE